MIAHILAKKEANYIWVWMALYFLSLFLCFEYCLIVNGKLTVDSRRTSFVLGKSVYNRVVYVVAILKDKMA